MSQNVLVSLENDSDFLILAKIDFECKGVVLHRYCDSSLFGGFEDIGSIKRVEIDLSNPTVMVYESSKFLGEDLV